MKTNVFESDKITKSIIVLALPTIVSQLITTIYNLADTFWVGMLNNHFQIAALSIVFPIQLTLTAIGNLFGLGAGTCISNAIGASEHKKAKSSSSFAIYVGVIVTLVLSLFVLFFSNVTLNILGSTEKTNEYVLSYLKYVVVLGAVPTVFNMIIANMIRAEGFSLQASIGLSIGGILNIVLDPIFVLPFGFNMEIKGAAIATLISNAITTIYFLILLIIIRKKTTISFVPKRMFETKKIGLEVIFTGIPSALQTMLSAVSNLVLNSLIISYGEVAEAAIGITKKVDAIPFGIITGLSQGSAPLMAYNNGAKKYDKMKKTLRYSLIYCIAAAIIIILAIEVFADSIISAFIKEENTILYGTKFLRLHCVSMIFMSVTFMLVSFFQSIGAKVKAFILSIIRKGVFDIPLMYLMNTIIPMYGVVACQPIMDFVSAGVAICFYFIWKKEHEQMCLNEEKLIAELK